MVAGSVFIPLEGGLGDAELRSLDLMKTIRHPHLTSLMAIWMIRTRSRVLGKFPKKSPGHLQKKKKTL